MKTRKLVFHQIVRKEHIISIHILCKETAPTVAEIARHLVSSGIETTFGRTPPNPDSFIINYGLVRRDANLNADITYNKLSQLLELRDHGILAPEVIRSGNLRNINLEDIPDAWFPFLARRSSHFKGKDIVWIPDRRIAARRLNKIRDRDFIAKYVPKSREFRVHVLGTRWVSISEKITEGEYIDDPNVRASLIWAHRYGWRHVVMKADDPIRPDVARIALDASSALSFHFGAVDVLLTRDNELMVLEINSAPSLVDRRAVLYAEYFAREYRKV